MNYMPWFWHMVKNLGAENPSANFKLAIVVHHSHYFFDGVRDHRFRSPTQRKPSIISPKQKNKWLLKPTMPALSLALLVISLIWIRKKKLT